MKKIFRNIHLYLGLTVGLVIMIICGTGTILVFEKEWQSTLYPERYFVEQQSATVPLTNSVAAVEGSVKNSVVTSIRIYGDPSRTLELTYSEQEKNNHLKNHQKNDEKKENPQKEKGSRGGKRQPRLHAFTNPYTGDVVSLYNHQNSFFFTVLSLHRWLLMGDTGKMITGISVFSFLFILVTGIILWWPKTKAKLKQHLTLKWNAKWKRLNHDLHIVIGFYTSIFLFAIALTGLTFSFEWVSNGIFWITGTENIRQEPPPSSIINDSTVAVTYDEAWEVIKKEVPSASYYVINKPKDEKSSYQVMVLPNGALHEKAFDQYFLDQYSGKLISTTLYKDRNAGQRIRATIYPIHVGSIGGMVGRIIALICCVAGVTFPVTGVILWINRLKKAKKKIHKKERKEQLKSTSDINSLETV